MSCPVPKAGTPGWVPLSPCGAGLAGTCPPSLGLCAVSPGGHEDGQGTRQATEQREGQGPAAGEHPAAAAPGGRWGAPPEPLRHPARARSWYGAGLGGEGVRRRVTTPRSEKVTRDRCRGDTHVCPTGSPTDALGHPLSPCPVTSCWEVTQGPHPAPVCLSAGDKDTDTVPSPGSGDRGPFRARVSGGLPRTRPLARRAGDRGEPG